MYPGATTADYVPLAAFYKPLPSVLFTLVGWLALTVIFFNPIRYYLPSHMYCFSYLTKPFAFSASLGILNTLSGFLYSP